MKSRKIKVHGISHQFYFWGTPQKPKLFLFHGWLDTGAGFDFLCEHLKKRFFCIAPDLRGYGRSGHTKNPLGYFFYEYMADLHAIFHRFSPKEKVRILGHSLGGAISSFYAGTFPERVGHFINVEGFGFRNPPPERGPERVRNWIETLHSQRFRMFPNLEAFVERLMQSNPRLPLERARFLAKYLTKKTNGKFIMAADPKHKLPEPTLFSKPLFYAFWRQIQARCLLVSAAQTNMKDWMGVDDFEKEIEERLSAFPAGSRRVTIPECGHMVHHERPEELAKVVLKFLI
jgi:pimeloyl-ACP methyl ester carboxylesterase